MKNPNHHPLFQPWLSIVTMTTIMTLMMVLSTMPSGALAEDKRNGLLSQVNNWFARLRGNRDQKTNQSNNDDNQKDEKKEETTTIRPGIAMSPMYPHGVYGMAPPGYAPMAPAMHGLIPPPSGGPMFAPMAAMSTHQFATHHHPPRMMHHSPPSFSPMPFVGMPPISMAAIASNPFNSYSAPPHLMPIHNDFPDSFGAFGAYGNEQNDPNDSFSGSGPNNGGPPMHHPHHPHHHLHHHPTNDPVDSSSSANGYDDSYSKK